MGKGVLDYADPHALGTVGLQSRDYAMAGFEDADVVIAIGYDLVEHAPEHWNPKRDKRIVVIDSVAAEIDAYFVPEVELIGDIYHVLTPAGRGVPRRPALRRLAPAARRRPRRASSGPRTTTHFPMQPPRALWEIRKALGRDDILISDVGLHKLWIGRMFPAHEPNTVLIANGLAGMGFALPCAIAAKIVHPDRKVVTVNGDGGVPHELPGARDRRAAGDPDRERHLGEQPVRLDRVEAGQEVRPPLRRRLHQPRLRQARRGVRAARLALRVGRGLRAAPVARAVPRRAVADRAADRLLDRRRDLRGARGRRRWST